MPLPLRFLMLAFLVVIAAGSLVLIRHELQRDVQIASVEGEAPSAAVSAEASMPEGSETAIVEEGSETIVEEAAEGEPAAAGSGGGRIRAGFPESDR